MSVLGKKRMGEEIAEIEEAVELFLPILAFLRASGISLNSATKAFSSAWRKALKTKSSVSVSNLRNTQDYIEIVSLWTKHPDFLDGEGLPRVLPLVGKKGFSQLVKRASKTKLRPTDALRILLQYGNVQKTGKRSLRLKQSFFHVRSTQSLAFEPSARFLADASATVRNSLAKQRSGNSLPQLFWRKADTTQLPATAIPAYLEYARSRSLVFLQEIDDWLQSHVAKRRLRRGRRVGLGLFSICGRSKMP